MFEHNGEQYVAVLSAGNALIGSSRGDSVWLFSLSGTLEPAAPGDTPMRIETVITSYSIHYTKLYESRGPGR